MDIRVPDKWLREFLKTKATVKQIGEYLSLSGPSVEKITKEKGSDIYHIEVTTNRVDSASIYGIAREAAAILPRFNVPAKLVNPGSKAKLNFVSKVDYLDATVDTKLCPRFTAVLIKNVKIGQSPDWMKERLIWVGERPINNIVDISNFVMHEIGQPVHTFDYDKIKKSKMILRESVKGEEVKTLDGNSYILPGGDIVIEDGDGRLIDLAGIMGGDLSKVDEYTKNVLLFVQNYNPINVRKTSMSLPKRTEAVVLFEKGVDSENVTLGMELGIDLFEKLTGGKAANKILDIYPKPYKKKVVSLTLERIVKILDVDIKKPEITKILTSLGFEISWRRNALDATVPSYRAADVDIPEDIIEEVARIYGYYNLPSKIPDGAVPAILPKTPFRFENNIKQTLKGYGGVETYTLSLVSSQMIGRSGALKLTNPLGTDGEYLRVSLMPSLTKAVYDNSQEKDKFFLFEIANIYNPRKNSLPDEVMTLGIIFSKYSFREAKGVIESLLKELNIDFEIFPEDENYFDAGKRLVIKSGSVKIGQFGVTTVDGIIYADFETEKLENAVRPKKFTPIPKYPAQVEDITLTFPEKTKIGNVMKLMGKNAELKEIYKDAYTFRIFFQDKNKTLTNKEVEELRNKMLEDIKTKFGGKVKE